MPLAGRFAVTTLRACPGNPPILHHRYDRRNLMLTRVSPRTRASIRDFIGRSVARGFWSGLALTITLIPAKLGTAQTLDTVIDNGPSANRVDMVFIGDGYQAHELDTTYVNHIQTTLDYLFTNPLASPFGRYQNFFNVHRVNVISNQSGADDPINNIFVNTALDASYNWDGSTDRLLYFSNSKANAAMNTALAGTGIDVDMRFGVVNATKYGGGGGQWAVYAGGNSAASELALHEVAHSFADLADEYFSPGTHTGGEFQEVNVTNNKDSGKWDRWVGYVDPESSIGPIGYYEGGRYLENGVWRPSQNSKMRSLGRPFDAVSREKFIHDLYLEVRPLDLWLDNLDHLIDPTTLWVSTVDPNVISVSWFIDETPLAFSGEALDIASLNLGVGSYSVRALAFDSVLPQAFSGGPLDWYRLDPLHLQQTVSWQFSVTAVPEPGHAIVLVMAMTMGVTLFRRRAYGSVVSEN